jgi:hypothetical protein
MNIIGVDFHPEFQQIASVDTDTGEFQEKRLAHREKAEKFYRALAGQKVLVGMEASGHARWFERLVAELQFELWVGDAAEIRTKRVRKQKDRQDAQLVLRLLLDDRFPQIWVPSCGSKCRPATCLQISGWIQSKPRLIIRRLGLARHRFCFRSMPKPWVANGVPATAATTSLTSVTITNSSLRARFFPIDFAQTSDQDAKVGFGPNFYLRVHRLGVGVVGDISWKFSHKPGNECNRALTPTDTGTTASRESDCGQSGCSLFFAIATPVLLTAMCRIIANDEGQEAPPSRSE